MKEILSVIYFIGLVMFGIAVAEHYDVTTYGFMIVGGGTILFAITGAMFHYLHGR